MVLSKIAPPSSLGTIPRPRLFRWLDRARQRPVTWIWAPPGAGKTTLVASYLIARKVRTLWYQIDSGDNDVATFFYYLGLAAPKRTRSMPLFTPEYQMGLPIFTRNFFRELFGRFKPPFALVFDNYQEIESHSQLHDALKEALAEIPQAGRVIFISRSEAPAAFAPIRAKQAVEILEWSEIRFTRSEVNELVKRLAPGRWAKRAIDQLFETADGWAAGLVLLLEQLRRDRQMAINADGKSPPVLFDYFAGEIFKRTESEAREVLLQTSFLLRVTAKMAEELTGIQGAGEVLAKLHRQNYFTNKRPGPEPTYEYHPLFREFLLAQASQQYTAEHQKQIRRKAGDIVKAAGRVEAAAELYRDAKDWEELTKLIRENAPTLMGQGRMKVVEEWIACIPQSVVENNPWLLYWRGTCWQGWRHKETQQDLEQAFKVFRRQQDVVGMLLCAASLIIAFEGEGYPVAMDPWIMTLEELNRETNVDLPPEIETQVTAALLAALSVRIPHHPNGILWAERALEFARRDDNLAFRALTAMNWVQYHYEIGQMTTAAVVLDEMRGLISAAGTSPIVATNASMSVCACEFLLAFPTYRQTVNRVLELAQSKGMFYAAKFAVLGYGLFAALSDGDMGLATLWLHELDKEAHLLGPGFHCFYRICSVWRALLANNLEVAAMHQPDMLRLGIRDGWPLEESITRLFSVLVLHARSSKDDARNHLDRAYEIARTMNSPYVEFMARTVNAHICFDDGQDAKGFDSLRIAMELGRKGSFVNSQVWLPKVMARLCAKALEHGIEVEYVKMLVRKRNLVPEKAPVDIEAWPWPIKIYTLGQFLVLKDNHPLTFSHKVQRKPLALLKAIIASGGKNVREETLLDLLWPEADGDAAHFALTSAIHRLRKLLGHEQALIRKDNEISLNERYCWVDVWAVERLLERVEAAVRENGPGTDSIRLLRRASELYKGPFLGADPEASWSTSTADRVRRGLLRHLSKFGQDYERQAQWQEAASVYEAALRVDPCAEDACRRLMTAYHHLGRPAEVISAYRHCKEALNNRLGVALAIETERLLKKLTVNFPLETAIAKLVYLGGAALNEIAPYCCLWLPTPCL